MPKVSIVLPTYNGSAYLRESIESCLNQTFRDFELIIVNDCSTDDTGTIAEEYAKKDPRVTVIHNNPNKKLPRSLNAGFEQAKGQYHTWTSDDNYYAPNALEVLVQEIEKDPATGFIYTNYTIIDSKGKVIGKRSFGDINKKFTSYQGSSACFLYKEELFKINGGYNPSYFLIEDYDFFVNSFLATKTVYLQRDDLYFYREHGASLSATRSKEVNDLAKMVIEQKMSRLEEKLPKAQLALLYRKYAIYKAKKNDKVASKAYLKKLKGISFFQYLLTSVAISIQKFRSNSN